MRRLHEAQEQERIRKEEKTKVPLPQANSQTPTKENIQTLPNTTQIPERNHNNENNIQLAKNTEESETNQKSQSEPLPNRTRKLSLDLGSSNQNPSKKEESGQRSPRALLSPRKLVKNAQKRKISLPTFKSKSKHGAPADFQITKNGMSTSTSVPSFTLEPTTEQSNKLKKSTSFPENQLQAISKTPQHEGNEIISKDPR